MYVSYFKYKYKLLCGVSFYKKMQLKKFHCKVEKKVHVKRVEYIYATYI